MMYSGYSDVESIVNGGRRDRSLIHEQLCQNERGLRRFEQWQWPQVFDAALCSLRITA